MREWRTVPFAGRYVAEFGEWKDDRLPADACESVAFIVAETEEQAAWVVSHMNDVGMEPRLAVGVVGRVEGTVAWLGPFDNTRWMLEWYGSDPQ